MAVLLSVLVGVMIFISLLIMLFILLQEDKSGGGIGIVGGSSQSFFGSSSASLLAKITTVLFALFVVLSLFLGWTSSKSTQDASITAGLVTQKEFEFDDTEDVAKTPVVKVLTELPAKILVEDFDGFIIAKIADEAKQADVLKVYVKDKNSRYYDLLKNAKDEDKAKVLAIFNEVGYTQDVVPTVVTP